MEIRPLDCSRYWTPPPVVIIVSWPEPVHLKERTSAQALEAISIDISSVSFFTS